MPYGDVLIHAGDFTELGLPSEVKKFNEWLGRYWILCGFDSKFVHLFTDCTAPSASQLKTIMHSETMNINLTFKFEWQWAGIRFFFP